MTGRRSCALQGRNVVLSVLSVALVQTRAPAQATTHVSLCLPGLLVCLQQETGGETPSDHAGPVHTLRDKSSTFNGRARALRKICTNGPEESIGAAFEVLEAWLSEVEAAPVERWGSDETLILHQTMIRHFMGNYAALAEGVLEDQRPLLALMQRIATSDVPHPAAHKMAIRAIALNPAPREARQEVLLSVVERRPGGTMCDEAYSLFDASTFPKLRSIFRALWRSGEVHFLAARLLAYGGDQEILPDLRASLPRLRERSANLAARLESDIWWIEIQHPPSQLIEYIASTEGGYSRTWAIERAVALGMPMEEVRKAILSHAEKLGPARDKRILRGLRPLKSAGIRLGVLRANDLPDVKLPDKRPVP